MAQATNPSTTSRFHNLSNGQLADALGHNRDLPGRLSGRPPFTSDNANSRNQNRGVKCQRH
jgi:hypothetical protein